MKTDIQKRLLGKCLICKVEFIKWQSTQKVCTPLCAAGYAKKIKAKRNVKAKKEEAKNDRMRREALKTRRDWINDAQTVFNRWVRLRDAGESCISCGSPPGIQKFGGSMDAGHFRSVGSAPHLRFDERNVNGQCKKCNRFGAGQAHGYRMGLIERIGRDAVEELESDQEPRKYTVEQLQEIIKVYRAKAKEIERDRD